MPALNRYPIYIISKGRWDSCLTANFLLKDRLDFKLVIEPQELEQYQKIYKDRVEVLPFSNQGLGSYPARNWCWEDSIKRGYKKHWILDDNIRGIQRLYKGIRFYSNSIHAFKFIEDLTDNYSNIGISGMNYDKFVTSKTKKPIVTNHHIYSNLLIDNSLPARWRLKYNEDTDLNLQVLKLGLCTLYTNIFLVIKMRTMTMKGGNTDELYKQDGRKAHPEEVKVKWKFNRPQHEVNWSKFKQPLIPIDEPKIIDLADYGTLKAINPIKSPALKRNVSEGWVGNQENLKPFTGVNDPRRQNGRAKGIPNSKTRYLRLLTLTEKIKNPVTGELEEFSIMEQLDMQLIAKARKGDIRAYQEIMDRLEGKPQQKVDMKVGVDPVEAALDKLGWSKDDAREDPGNTDKAS